MAGMIAKDKRAVNTMVSQGKIVMLPPRTLAEVVGAKDNGMGFCRVHLQSGEHIGEDWWVPAFSVKPLR